jgi:hypothetical protein
MIGEYSCSYLLNSGKTCNRPCIRPEGCRFHWKSKKRVPCSDCGKPTGSISGRCPLHIRGYYVAQYYNRLRSIESANSNIQEGSKSHCSAIITYENILLAHKDALENLNITLCRECFHPIKADEGEYCDSCQPE